MKRMYDLIKQYEGQEVFFSSSSFPTEITLSVPVGANVENHFTTTILEVGEDYVTLDFKSNHTTFHLSQVKLRTEIR